MSDILVSVICISYNHDKYIRSALDGFVNQKTDFKYEVIIHDDASTDKTQDIIKEYEEKYPDVFVCIYQKENQFSKGKNIIREFCIPKVRGKYIAWCEGDDYWCDEKKLQRQVDFLEKNEDYSACVCSSKVQYFETKKEEVVNKTDSDKDLCFEKLLSWRGEGHFDTCTLLFRAKYGIKPIDFEKADFDDYPQALYLALNGKIRMLKEVMGVYRVSLPGSWTSKYKDDIEFQKEHLRQVDYLLNAVDQYSKLRFHDEIEYEKKKRWYPILYKEGQYKKLIKEYKVIWNKEKLKTKIYLFLLAYFPIIIKIKKKVRKDI